MSTTLDTDLESIQQRAAAQQDAYAVLRYQLQFDDDLDDTTIDAAVRELARPIIEAIDCTQCGNCCRSLDVYIRKFDAERLAHQVNMTLESFVKEYVDRESARPHEEWGKFRHCPCAFLEGKRCSVYDHRPDACREYPVLTPNFRWILDELIEGAATCPIIFNVLQKMLTHADELQRDL